jgi:trk system potassium uptake protein TrkA
VGRSTAQALLAAGHKVLLIERDRSNYRPARVPDADWMLGDACELAALRKAGIETCDVVAATAGDDKTNLVFALLAKTEFGVARVVARINNPDNQWLFTEAWGVDIAVSTPSRLVAAVEEAVSVGEIVQLLALRGGSQSVAEIRLPAASEIAGRSVAELALPQGATVVAIVRDDALIRPGAETVVAADDELVLVVDAAVEDEVRRALSPTPSNASGDG